MQLHITPVMEPGNKSLAASLIESINLMLPWGNWRNGFFSSSITHCHWSWNSFYVWTQQLYTENSVQVWKHCHFRNSGFVLNYICSWEEGNSHWILCGNVFLNKRKQETCNSLTILRMLFSFRYASNFWKS
jgi:hypothetical protein